MGAVEICIIGFALIFGGAVLGMFLREILPDHHLRDESKDTIKVGVATVSTLSAMVLGLLVSSAKNSYDTMNSEMIQSAANVVLLDRVLANYGDETKTVRKQLHASIVLAVDQMWPEQGIRGPSAAVFERINYLEGVQLAMLNLKPATDAQRVLLSQAEQLMFGLRQTRWLLVEQSHNALPSAFLVVLIFWLTVMHFSFGLFAPRNLTVFAALFLCSVSVSCALFIIIELSHPMHGVVRISGAPMRNALAQLNK